MSKCPNCDKDTYCGCKSCKPRKGLDPRRSQRMKGDFFQCPYCKKNIHADAWLDKEAEEVFGKRKLNEEDLLSSSAK